MPEHLVSNYIVELPPAWRNTERTANLAKGPLQRKVDLRLTNTQPLTEDRGSAVRRLRRSGQRGWRGASCTPSTTRTLASAPSVSAALRTVSPGRVGTSSPKCVVQCWWDQSLSSPRGPGCTQVERGNKKEKRLHFRIPRLLQPGTDAEAAEMKSCLDCAIEMNCRHQHHRQHIVFKCLFYSDSETMAS